jgi:hypothetical protein
MKNESDNSASNSPNVIVPATSNNTNDNQLVSEISKNNNENLRLSFDSENNTNNNDSSAAINDDSLNGQNSSNADAPKSRLNPFAQEFNPIIMRSQLLSPLNTSGYIPVNQPIVNNNNNNNINNPNLNLSFQQPHATQIFINPTTVNPNNQQQAVYILNQQPYQQQPAYIPSPVPNQVPAPGAPAHLKTKKGEPPVNHGHPMSITPNMQQIPPNMNPGMPPQHQIPQVAQMQPQQRNTQIAYQPGSNQTYTTITPQQQMQQQPNGTTPGIVTSYPQQQQQMINSQSQNQIIYTTQPMNYQNPSK